MPNFRKFKIVSLIVLAGWGEARAEIIFDNPPVVAPSLITHSTAGFQWTNPAGVTTDKRAAYDTAAYFQANGTLRYSTVIDAGKTFSGVVSIGLSGLQSNTSYVACVKVASATDSTNCTSAGHANSRVNFQTLPLPAQHPTMPELPAEWDSGYPASFGAVLTVAPNCADFSSKLTAAYGAAYSGLNVKIVVPSDRHSTGGAGTCNNPVFPSTKTGGGWVVVATDDEALLPPESVRVNMEYAAAGYLVTLRAGASDQVAMSTSGPATNLRMVGFRFAPATGPVAGDGNPKVQTHLVRFDGGASGLIMDRSVFDCIGYPYRVQHTFYGKGSSIAALSSYWNNCYIWKGWTNSGLADTNGNAAVLATAPFVMGRGNQTDSVGAFTITLNGTSGTGSAVLYEEAGGGMTFKYSAGSPISNCTGITCTLDAALTVPSGALRVTREATLAYTNGQFTYGGTPLGTLTGLLYANTLIDLLQAANGSLVDAEWQSNGPELDEGAGGTTIQNVKYENNYFGVSGFGVFVNGDGNTRIHDIVIRGNEFQGHTPALIATAPTTSSNPYAATRRQDIEFKNGYKVLIEGNTFRDGWISVGGNTAAAIALKRDLVLSPPNNRTGDFTIRDNVMERESACFYIAGDSGNSSAAPYTYLIRNIVVENNLCRTHGGKQAQWYIPRDTITTGGFFMWYDQMQEDLILRHNTVQQYGSVPSMLLRTDQCGEGLELSDNIFLLHAGQTAAYRGVAAGASLWGAATPPCTVGAGQDGTAALTANYPSNGGAVMKGNLIIAGCVDALTCTESSSGGALLGSQAGQYPSGNTWIASGSLKTRLDAVGWIDRNEGNWALAATSSHNAGQHASFDGTDPGVNWARNVAARGVVSNVRVLDITTNSAMIGYMAPKPGISCRVAYRTGAGLMWSVTDADSSDVTERTVSLSGLSANDQYLYEVWCESSKPTTTRDFRLQP